MKISGTLTDDSVLAEIGHRLARQRLDRNLTQAEVAEAAGVSKRTVERTEAGESTQSANLIRILRVLDLLDGLDRLLPTSQPSPLEQLERQGKRRRRASGVREIEPPARAWTWGDDA